MRRVQPVILPSSLVSCWPGTMATASSAIHDNGQGFGKPAILGMSRRKAAKTSNPMIARPGFKSRRIESAQEVRHLRRCGLAEHGRFARLGIAKHAWSEASRTQQPPTSEAGRDRTSRDDFTRTLSPASYAREQERGTRPFPACASPLQAGWKSVIGRTPALFVCNTKTDSDPGFLDKDVSQSGGVV